MKRLLLTPLLVLALFVAADGKTKPKKQPACATDIGACSDEGCSSKNTHDPKLNKRKNLKTNSKPVTDRTLTWLKNRPDPKDYKPGDDRDELTDIGEGNKIRTVGYLLAVKLELGVLVSIRIQQSAYTVHDKTEKSSSSATDRSCAQDKIGKRRGWDRSTEESANAR